MSIIGSQFKINVYLEPIGNVHLEDCDFTCTFFTSHNKFIKVYKSDMIRADKDNFIALVDSSKLGVGTIKMTMEVDVIDSDFKSGVRKEIKTVCTGIKICAKDVS